MIRCPGCFAANDAAAAFCSRCGVQLEGAESGAGYLPRHLAARYLAPNAGPVGEQRQITVLFVDLVQSTEILHAVGGEEMADLLDELLDGIAGAVNDFAGTVVDLAGDGALCVFGAPAVHEDDPERALRAALGIQRFVAGLRPLRISGVEWRPRVRVGVHTGTVVLRVIGQGRRLKYAPVGDAVHLAQRLQAAAQPAETLVSATTRRFTASLFRFGEPRTLSLKGFADPHVAVPLLGEGDAIERRPIRVGAAVFVGREADLAAVRARVDDLTRGAGGVLTVWGEAGIGKSRLLAEVRGALPEGVTWLEGRAFSYASNTPYSILGQQMRRAAGVDGKDTERSARDKLRALVAQVCDGNEHGPIFPFIATALGMSLDGPEDGLVRCASSDALQRAILGAFRDLVAATARRGPVVLVFEDLHWSDRTSVAAIEGLLPLVDTHPVLYMLVARPDAEAPSWQLWRAVERTYPHRHTHLALGPLSAEASSALAGSLLHTDRLSEEVRGVVLDKAEGVPLFVEELTKSLIEQKVLRRAATGWRLTISPRDLRIPDTVQGIILARLDRLGDKMKRMVQAAAVIGPVVDSRVLGRVTGEHERLEGRLHELQRLGFLREARRPTGIEFVFKHALIRDVAYQTMLQRDRVDLHAKVGVAIENVLGERLAEHHSVVAEHFQRAGAWDRAAHYLVLAGDEAARLHAHAEARRHYAEAMDALEHLADAVPVRRRRVDIIIKQASVSYIAEPPDRNLARLAEGEKLARAILASTDARGPDPTGTDRLRLGWIQYWTGRVNYIRGDPAQAIDHYERALATARELGDARLRTIALAMVGQAYTTQGRWGHAKRLLGEALPVLEAAAEWREWCLVSGYLGVSIVACGDYNGGIAVIRHGIERAMALQGWNLIASTHVLLCAAYLVSEQMTALAEAARETVAASERSGEQVVLYVGLGFLGWAEGRLGNRAAAIANMERSAEVGRDLGQLLLADWFAVARADLARCDGDGATALALAEKAVAVARRAGSAFSEGLAHRVWAQALAEATPPRHDEAEGHLATAVELLAAAEGRLQVGHTYRVWAELRQARGDMAGALDHFRQAAAHLAASGLAEEIRQVRAAIDETATTVTPSAARGGRLRR
jgi:class 3 adenylate cyclase/tetratricopeptide (TPR) repeat protein